MQISVELTQRGSVNRHNKQGQRGQILLIVGSLLTLNTDLRKRQGLGCVNAARGRYDIGVHDLPPSVC